MSYELNLTNGKIVKHIPTIKEEVNFIDWLKKNNAYELFIKIADLPGLSVENNPEYFLSYINWDNMPDNDVSYWDIIVDDWLIFISKREWSLINNGLESNEKFTKEIFNRSVIAKLKNIDFNKLTNEQYEMLNKILK